MVAALGSHSIRHLTLMDVSLVEKRVHRVSSNLMDKGWKGAGRSWETGFAPFVQQ